MKRVRGIAPFPACQFSASVVVLGDRVRPGCSRDARDRCRCRGTSPCRLGFSTEFAPDHRRGVLLDDFVLIGDHPSRRLSMSDSREKVMMMKSVVVVAILVALSAAPALAGEIFGTLSGRDEARRRRGEGWRSPSPGSRTRAKRTSSARSA
ncbi:MAG: hypothetical protein MZU97_07085 [Bacillus subtilis]|nr:hypothetical protein [Bacillus subtilis]